MFWGVLLNLANINHCGLYQEQQKTMGVSPWMNAKATMNLNSQVPRA
jgi:hypothetical protein